MADEPAGMVRIGELSRRMGVSVHVLRAWERRYGLLRPARSPGGYRLYTETDELRVKAMCAHLARGVSTAEAARAVLLRLPVRADEAAAGPSCGTDHRLLVPGGLRRLARAAPLALGGRGATPRLARAAGARLLSGDAVTEARGAVLARRRPDTP